MSIAHALQTILVYSKDRHLFDQIRIQLEGLQHIKLLHFDQAAAALEWVQHSPFHLALIDDDDHLTSGLQFARSLILAGQSPQAHVIILSTTPPAMPTERIQEFNVAEIIHKTTDLEELQGICGALLSQDTHHKDTEPFTAPPLYSDEAAELTNDGLWEWDILHNHMRFSSKWKALLGYRDQELPDGPATFFGRIHPEDIRDLNATLDTNLNSLNKTFSCEFRLRLRSGDYVWVQTRGYIKRDRQGRPIQITASQRNISVYKNLEQELSHNAFHDSLTGLPNRLLFSEQLKQAFLRFRRDRAHRFAVMFTDMDGFKQINDRLGHAMGDELLKVLASRLRQAVRGVDTVARLAGDEFTVLITDYDDLVDVETTAQRILQEVSKPITLSQTRLRPSISIGIAYSRPEHHAADDILKEADSALYEAKDRGKSCHVIYKPTKTAPSHPTSSESFETMVHHGLARGEITLHYQPLYALSHRQLKGYEALVRWHSPELGLVMPEHLFNHIDDTHLIAELARFTLRESMAALKKLQMKHQDPTLRMRVNCSFPQLTMPTLLEDVKNAIYGQHLSPHHLILEFQELTLKQYRSTFATALDDLRALGVGISLDNFGEGATSLNTLAQKPYDEIKLHSTLIREAQSSDHAQMLLKMMLTLQDLLNTQLICEQVENAQDLAYLMTLSDRLWGQGFHLHPPCPLDVLLESTP
ncbi:MAG: putative bifunctional diguanylate cyclase/phosphodiesterase [Holosporales bacterium]